MRKLDKALRLSNDEWVDSLPDKLEEYQLSDDCQNKMNSILCKSKELKVKAFPKRTLRFILIAAIIASILIASTAIAIPSSRKFLIDKFYDHSVYTVDSTKNRLRQMDLACDYVPDGFTLDEIHYDADGYIIAYEFSSNDNFYSVDKTTDDAVVTFDTEHFDPEEIEINGIAYLYYKSSETFGGLIWNTGGYIYTLGGNISKEELLNIAQFTR